MLTLASLHNLSNCRSLLHADLINSSDWMVWFKLPMSASARLCSPIVCSKYICTAWWLSWLQNSSLLAILISLARIRLTGCGSDWCVDLLDCLVASALIADKADNLFNGDSWRGSIAIILSL